ncbi:pyridoxamine 5'-phosphate oxidase family protein [Mobilitalea sibirica]|uniref:Pyridoxamine 5'-phosphate oxidase family protein n=1 Tax=Mobilitalea sibirica TaxID=1462919 RepID=A0A8J7KXG8_9FIRM|nr:pyridoxamine 5'-phosphate oxidase family protein [Mobilitalea sibirica]MBH1941772.1 pyridoxamine 5'-phosphate oxidase family protein [Mobilitalea sibirica]
MRRKDREVTDINDILDILQKCDVCRIAFFDNEYPYILPLNFGYVYENDVIKLYFHGAKEGKKLQLIKNNPKVAFEMDCSHKLITGKKACDYTMEYESICGTGVIEILDEDQTEYALTQIMKQYSDQYSFEFDERYLKAVSVLQLTVKQINGKRLHRSH